MIYRAIGVMSGSSLDGLDIAFTEFHENGGKWTYEILHAECIPYSEKWIESLQQAVGLNARDYQLLHSAYGHYVGEQLNDFINRHNLQYKVSLIASHGHTTFHLPQMKMTAQLGDGAAIAAVTRLPVVSDLRAMDVALGGQGAPIVPVGEKLLWPGYEFYLNLGGIANVTIMRNDGPLAFDVCPANRVLNMLAKEKGREFDRDGEIAASGEISNELLDKLNALSYYQQIAPKSLANDFGTHTVFPMVVSHSISNEDMMRTYAEHIAFQITGAVVKYGSKEPGRIFITGGGALNKFLTNLISNKLAEHQIETVIPADNDINYKEAVVMSLIGVLRWRQEANVYSSVTGADRDSVGGALWFGEV